LFYIIEVSKSQEGQNTGMWKNDYIFLHFVIFVLLVISLFFLLMCLNRLLQNSFWLPCVFRVCTSSYVGWSHVLCVTSNLALSYLNQMKCRSQS